MVSHATAGHLSWTTSKDKIQRQNCQITGHGATGLIEYDKKMCTVSHIYSHVLEIVVSIKFLEFPQCKARNRSFTIRCSVNCIIVYHCKILFKSTHGVEILIRKSKNDISKLQSPTILILQNLLIINPT